MTETNVALVRRAYEAWNRGDFDAAFAILHPDVEVSVPPNFPEAGTLRGRDEVRRWIAEQFLPVLEAVQARPERFLEAGDRVVVFVRYSGRGRASGVEVRDADVDSHVWTLRNGRARRLEMHSGTESALQAVGLGAP